jgi:hypothetical protein
MSKRSRSPDSPVPVPVVEVPVVDDPAAWATLQGVARGSANLGYYSFYSSMTGAITTNVSLMGLPIDDHAIVRGHAVFDTCSLARGRLYRLQIHLDRLLSSAKAARLPLPFGSDESISRQKMVDIIKATARASGQQTCDVRYWLTAGTGNLGVTPAGCATGFYVLTFGGLPTDPAWHTQGIPEASIPVSVVPHKPAHLAELKSNK